jgi:hypothetical protein
MAYTLGKMEIVMKENGTCVLSTEQALISSLMEILILVSTKTANPTEKDNTLGRTVQSMLEISIQE